MNRQLFVDGLKPFLPPTTEELIADWLMDLQLKVVLWENRQTKLGDFRAARQGRPAQISVNKSLNKYAFLITIVHEIAHAAVYRKYQRNVQPHGLEWKKEYRDRMLNFLTARIFPKELEPVIANHLKNPRASANADLDLERALRQYNTFQDNSLTLDDLQLNDVFSLENGNVFRMIGKQRTRYKCYELSTGKNYLISGLAVVKLMDKEKFVNIQSKAKDETLLKDLTIGTRFKLSNGMVLTKGEKKRTRFICLEPKTGKHFLVPGDLLVKL